MGNRIKAFYTAFFNLLIALLLFTAMQGSGATNAEAATGVGFLLALSFAASLVPAKQTGAVLRSEVLRIMFSREIQQYLFPANEFYQGAQNDPDIAIDTESIEVPQDESGMAQYVVNPNSFPLSIVTEEDSKKIYSADLIATKPQLVTDLNQALVSYDKRQSKLMKHSDTLNTIAAERILYGWSPTEAAQILKTTGSDTRAADVSGASGNRKRIIKDDILKAMTLMNAQDIPAQGRKLILSPNQFEDLLRIDEFIHSEKLRMSGNLAAGQIGEVLGFSVFMRSQTTRYVGNISTPTKAAPDAAGSTHHSFAALFYHPRFVRYAKGVAKMYIDSDKPEYLGTVMNAALRSGGMISRLSQKGVVALVDAVA